jgi:hypothetical protein
MRGTARLAAGRLPVGALRQPHASRPGDRDALDRATLSRLTWLWLAYGAFALATGQRQLPSVCPFRLITGHGCPLCGLTRSVNRFMRGQVRSSLEEHWAGPALYVGGGLFLAAAWRRAGASPGGQAPAPADTAAANTAPVLGRERDSVQ